MIKYMCEMVCFSLDNLNGSLFFFTFFFRVKKLKTSFVSIRGITMMVFDEKPP